MSKTNVTLDSFITHLEEEVQNRSIYVWGAQGQGSNVISEAWIRSMETSDKNADKAIKLWKQRVAEGYGKVLRAFDCSGLGMAFIQNETGISKNDMSANSMMKKCEIIPREQVKKGCWAFDVDSSGKATHIGYVVDDQDSTIEARGRAYGVVKRPLDEGDWNRYGIPSYFKDEIKGTATGVAGTISTGSKADEKTIWDFLMSKISNEYGVAGLMGNLYAESALKSNNLQNSCEKKLGYTDTTYTAAVDSGAYTNFIKDSAGYGLAQWTHSSRKQKLFEYAQDQKKSIGDLITQLEFLHKELAESYKSVLNDLKTATSVLAASNSVLTKYERPANQGESVQKKRAEYGQKYYKQYAKGSPADATPETLLSVGTEVDFTGSKHYTSSYASATGKICKPGKAKITAIAPGKPHPYHCVAVNGTGATVHGWVDAADVVPIAEKIIKKGDKVKVLKAKTYTGGTFKIYYDTYDVISVNGDRVVIGQGKTVTAAVHKDNLKLN